jgi:hypothetical protein
MFMPKIPLSVTLGDANLLWLRGRAAGRKKRSLSEALDEILTEARQGGTGADAPRSVMGTVDIADDDPRLDRADASVRSLFDESMSRPVLVREATEPYPPPVTTPAARNRRAGGRKRRG